MSDRTVTIFVYPNNIVDASQCLRQATNLDSCKICVSWPKISSSNMENIVYSKYVHQLIKDMGTNMLTLQPSQLSLQIRTFVTTSIILVIAVYSYDLLRYFIPS